MQGVSSLASISPPPVLVFSGKAPRFAGADIPDSFRAAWRQEAEELVGWLREERSAAGTLPETVRQGQKPAFLSGFASLGEGMASLLDWSGGSRRHWRRHPHFHPSRNHADFGAGARAILAEATPELIKRAYADGSTARLLANQYFLAALEKQGERTVVRHRSALVKAIGWSRVADGLAQEKVPLWIPAPGFDPQGVRTMKIQLSPEEDAAARDFADRWFELHPELERRPS